jgi:hypothetical protein
MFFVCCISILKTWGKVGGWGKKKTEREPLIFDSKYTAEQETRKPAN